MATVGAGTLHGAPTRGPTFGRQGDPPKNAALARREMVQIRIKVKHRDTFEVVAGAVTGTLTQPGELILGRYDDGELRIIGRTGPLKASATRSLVPFLKPPAIDHPWPSVISSRTYDRFQPKHETQLTLIQPLTVEISADTAVVGGTIRHVARFIRARPESDPRDIG